MRYLYIAGLEHSGTTLLSQALASQANVLSLGEVGQFLSRSHMQEYLRRWGAYSDVTRCSCGAEWSECVFWSHLIHLNGVFDDDKITDGYRQLLAHLQSRSENLIVVDSSKSLQHLNAFRSAWQALGLPDDRAGLVVLTKDPRGFAHSVGKKGKNKATLISAYRAMNWWQSVYAQWLEYESGAVFWVKRVSYEQICLEPQRVWDSVANLLDVTFQSEIKVSHSNSHIALGNKDFIERNRGQITYDVAWKHNWQIQAAYFLNGKARKTYSDFQDMSR